MRALLVRVDACVDSVCVGSACVETADAASLIQALPIQMPIQVSIQVSIQVPPIRALLV